jgi:hypothetical protein
MSLSSFDDLPFFVARMSFPENFVDTPWRNCQTLGVLWKENRGTFVSLEEKGQEGLEAW